MRSKRRNRKYTSEQYHEAMHLHTEGLSARRIGKKMNISLSRIGGWIYNGQKPFSAWSLEELKERNKAVARAKLGPLNPNWGGDNVKPDAGRLRANRLYHVPKGYERHHIDGDPLNNARENIAVVTRRQHMILDGRMEKLIKRSKMPRKNTCESKIRELLKIVDRPISSKEIAQKTEANLNTVRGRLCILKKKGVVNRPFYGHYSLVSRNTG